MNHRQFCSCQHDLDMFWCLVLLNLVPLGKSLLSSPSSIDASFTFLLSQKPCCPWGHCSLQPALAWLVIGPLLPPGVQVGWMTSLLLVTSRRFLPLLPTSKAVFSLILCLHNAVIKGVLGPSPSFLEGVYLQAHFHSQKHLLILNIQVGDLPIASLVIPWLLLQ